MKVEPISNGNLRVWLQADEMPTDIRDGVNWSVLRRVLRAVQRSLGRMGKQLVAELIPVADGGVLLLSARSSSVGAAPIYAVDSVDNLYALAEAWIALPLTDTSHTPMILYETAQGYTVVLYPQTHLTRAETTLLHTYAVLIGCGTVDASRCAEYGRRLASGDVFEQLITREPKPPELPDPVN